MKNFWKLAFVAFVFTAFTACSNQDNGATESDTIESTDEVESDMETDMDMMETDTTMMEDTTMMNIQEEQPPIE